MEYGTFDREVSKSLQRLVRSRIDTAESERRAVKAENAALGDVKLLLDKLGITRDSLWGLESRTRQAIDDLRVAGLIRTLGTAINALEAAKAAVESAAAKSAKHKAP